MINSKEEHIDAQSKLGILLWYGSIYILNLIFIQSLNFYLTPQNFPCLLLPFFLGNKGKIFTDQTWVECSANYTEPHVDAFQFVMFSFACGVLIFGHRAKECFYKDANCTLPNPAKCFWYAMLLLQIADLQNSFLIPPQINSEMA